MIFSDFWIGLDSNWWYVNWYVIERGAGYFTNFAVELWSLYIGVKSFEIWIIQLVSVNRCVKRNTFYNNCSICSSKYVGYWKVICQTSYILIKIFIGETMHLFWMHNNYRNLSSQTNGTLWTKRKDSFHRVGDLDVRCSHIWNRNHSIWKILRGIFCGLTTVFLVWKSHGNLSG